MTIACSLILRPIFTIKSIAIFAATYGKKDVPRLNCLNDKQNILNYIPEKMFPIGDLA